MAPSLSLSLSLLLLAGSSEQELPKNHEPREALPDAAPAPSATDREVLRQGIEALSPRLKACYEQRLLERPELAGSLTARFRVEPDGRVLRATFVEKTLTDEPLEACVRAVLLSLRLPPQDRVTMVTYPFAFRREAAPPPPTEPGLLERLRALFGCG